MHVLMHDLVSTSARTYPTAAALTSGETTVSYQDLWREIVDVSGGLVGLGSGGLVRGDRVAVYLDKRIEAVVAIFATSAAGGVFVPVNPLLRPKQVGHILGDCDVSVLVTATERFSRLRDELAGCKSLTHVVLVGEPPADVTGVHYEVVVWPELRHRVAPAPAAGIDQDIAAIFYTSGSTGRPKGVVLSHRNLIVGAQAVGQYLGNRHEDVILAALPLSFDAGFSQLTTAFSVGAHVVLMNYLLPRDVVTVCAKHGITGLTCVPPLWMQLADQKWPHEATGSLRYFANTGGRMPKATLDRLREIFTGAKPYLMYGLTEAFRSTYLDPDEVDRRPDSIGKAIPNTEIMVVRPDGSPCDPGEEGELVHRGALVAMGYWNDPTRTAERFRPAPGRERSLSLEEIAVWSGDTVVRDEEGFLYFVGRRDEMIKTSGYRVSPTEIEEAAYDTGLVREVVAIGVADPRIDQHIVIVVSPAEGSEVDRDALLSALKRMLPAYMVPRDVLVRESIPRSANGKFDRNLLRQELST